MVYPGHANFGPTRAGPQAGDVASRAWQNTRVVGRIPEQGNAIAVGKRANGTQTLGVVVVAGDDHHGAPSLVAETRQGIVVQVLGDSGRVYAVEHVTSDKDKVDLFFLCDVTDFIDEVFVFWLAAAAFQGAAEMPVRRVQDPQRACHPFSAGCLTTRGRYRLGETTAGLRRRANRA